MIRYVSFRAFRLTDPEGGGIGICLLIGAVQILFPAMRYQHKFLFLPSQTLGLWRREIPPVPHLPHPSVQSERYGILFPGKDFIFVQSLIGNGHAAAGFMDIDKQLLVLGIARIFPDRGHGIAPLCHLKNGIRIMPWGVQAGFNQYAEAVIQRLVVKFHLCPQSSPHAFQNIGNRNRHGKGFPAASGFPVLKLHQIPYFPGQPFGSGNRDFHGYFSPYGRPQRRVLHYAYYRLRFFAENRGLSRGLKINILISDIPGVLQHYRLTVGNTAFLMGDIHRPVAVYPAG